MKFPEQMHRPHYRNEADLVIKCETEWLLLTSSRFVPESFPVLGGPKTRGDKPFVHANYVCLTCAQDFWTPQFEYTLL